MRLPAIKDLSSWGRVAGTHVLIYGATQCVVEKHGLMPTLEFLLSYGCQPHNVSIRRPCRETLPPLSWV